MNKSSFSIVTFRIFAENDWMLLMIGYNYEYTRNYK